MKKLFLLILTVVLMTGLQSCSHKCCAKKTDTPANSKTNTDDPKNIMPPPPPTK